MKPLGRIYSALFAGALLILVLSNLDCGQAWFDELAAVARS